MTPTMAKYAVTNPTAVRGPHGTAQNMTASRSVHPPTTNASRETPRRREPMTHSRPPTTPAHNPTNTTKKCSPPGRVRATVPTVTDTTALVMMSDRIPRAAADPRARAPPTSPDTTAHIPNAKSPRLSQRCPSVSSDTREKVRISGGTTAIPPRTPSLTQPGTSTV